MPVYAGKHFGKTQNLKDPDYREMYKNTRRHQAEHQIVGENPCQCAPRFVEGPENDRETKNHHWVSSDMVQPFPILIITLKKNLST